MLAARSRSQLLLIDIQSRLVPHLEECERLIANCGRLIAYARRLDVPITITEHYPKGLGTTLPALTELLGTRARRVEKTEFSAWRNGQFREHVAELRISGRDQIVIAGAEAHVCVCQTAIDLLLDDFNVFVVADAVASRQSEVRALALERMARAGAVIVSHEMVAFEWLGAAATPAFNDLIGIIK
jgi:isochorismate hydrolase